jgi:hypothetical protein
VIFGYNLTSLPKVETQDQRVALALFREARSSNSPYLSFLFHWQVLEVGRGAKPDRFVDRTLQKGGARLRLPTADVQSLPLGLRSLGQYMLDDCRHAIAHIKRKPGKKRLDLDSGDERMRLTISARVMEVFSEHYIREVLGLREQLHLVRRRGGTFPVFADEATLRTGGYQRAYASSNQRLARLFGGARS